MIGIGIIGLGTVGTGAYKILKEHGSLIKQRTGIDCDVVRIADVDIERDRGIPIEKGLLTRNAMEVIEDKRVDIVVELMGGTEPALTYITEALKRKKWVVTANKALLAERGDEIFRLVEEEGCEIGFEASVCGGIPVIRAIRDGLVGNRLNYILGILNGTCNYILTRMENEGLPFGEVLRAAQKAGYAEANPGLDIDGFDTAHKAIILASLAYGFHVPMEKVLVEGIRNLSGMDVRYAAEFGYRIKLLAVVRHDGDEIEVRVHPTLVPLTHMLASVSNVFNAAMVRGDLSGDTLYYGRGAGREPTASTVIGDIGDIARNLMSGKSRYRRGVCVANAGKLRVRIADDIVSRYYVRLMVHDKAGSLGVITTILGKHGVSILAATQKVQPEEMANVGYVPVVILTYAAKGSEIGAALSEICAAGVLNEEPVKLRMI